MPLQLVYTIRIDEAARADVLAILERFKTWNESKGATLRNWTTLDEGEEDIVTQIIEFADQETFDAVMEARPVDPDFAGIIGDFMSSPAIELVKIARMEEV